MYFLPLRVRFFDRVNLHGEDSLRNKKKEEPKELNWWIYKRTKRTNEVFDSRFVRNWPIRFDIAEKIKEEQRQSIRRLRRHLNKFVLVVFDIV